MGQAGNFMEDPIVIQKSYARMYIVKINKDCILLEVAIIQLFQKSHLFLDFSQSLIILFQKHFREILIQYSVICNSEKVN